MGYEKEKGIVRQDRQRALSRTLHGSRKVALDFTDADSGREARLSVQGVLAEFIGYTADGTISYFTVGKSRDGGAILITVNYPDGQKEYAGGPTWEKLDAELGGLFAGS